MESKTKESSLTPFILMRELPKIIAILTKTNNIKPSEALAKLHKMESTGKLFIVPQFGVIVEE